MPRTSRATCRSLPRRFPITRCISCNYRGFGGSGGSPSEEAIAEDALALFDQVYASHPQVSLIGRSLGSGVAVRLASQRPVQNLILVTPYNSLEEIAVTAISVGAGEVVAQGSLRVGQVRRAYPRADVAAGGE
jgi:pimeloyl-ACP methyl ester carboxylesterase